MLNIECPLNSLSLGQVSVGLLRELYSRKIDVNLFPLGGNVDLSAQPVDNDFFSWLQHSINKATFDYKPSLPSLTIWHLNGSFKTFPGKNKVLWTAHETNSVTETEKNICNAYSKVFVTSEYSRDVFSKKVKNVDWCPNYFDSVSFCKKEIKKEDGVIQFLLCGKLEKRKLTREIISFWASMFGSNPKFRLNLLVSNPFINNGRVDDIIDSIFKGQRPWNINILPFQEQNSVINDIINFVDIDISGLSGAEGWNLPAFNSICLDKTSIILNAHAHKSYANEQNSILVDSAGMVDIYDGVFFNKGAAFNQGQMDTIDYKSAEKAFVKAISGEFVNKGGEQLANKFSVSNTADILLNYLQ